MRIRTQRFVLTVSGDPSAIELDVTTATPTIKLLDSSNIKLSIDEILSAPAAISTETRSLKDRSLDILNRKRPVAGLRFSNKSQDALGEKAPKPGTSKSKVWAWFLQLDINEALELFDRNSSYAIAQSINTYQNLAHAIAALEKFSDPQKPLSALRSLQRRFRAPISVFERSCFIVPKGLGLIEAVPSATNSSYIITALGKEVLKELNVLLLSKNQARRAKLNQLLLEQYKRS